MDKMQTDIIDSKTKEPIIEGDIVVLYDWGWDTEDTIIGFTKIYWNSEYHKWDFDMIEGLYIDNEYDRWRTAPHAIFRNNQWLDQEIHARVGDRPNNGAFLRIISEDRIASDIRFKQKELVRTQEKNKKKLEEKQKEINKLNDEIKKLEKERQDLQLNIR